MVENNDIWKEFWEEGKCSPIYTVPPKEAYGGTNIEPLASMGMAHFLDPLRDDFKENIKILDYGGGAGILGNFISERLQKFEYFCLEPKGEHGESRIKLGKNLFKDPRVFFGFIEEDLDYCFSKNIDAIILISIFTHLEKQDIEESLDRLHKVFDFNPDCQIIFSCFLGNEYVLDLPEPHIWKRFYRKVTLEEKYIENICKEKGFNIQKCNPFVAMYGHRHEIFKLTKG